MPYITGHVWALHLILLIDSMKANPACRGLVDYPRGFKSSKRSQVSGGVPYKSHRPRNASRCRWVDSFDDLRCRFGPGWVLKLGGRVAVSRSILSPSYLLSTAVVLLAGKILSSKPGLITVTHSFYVVTRFMSSAMSKTTLLAAFLAVTSSVRAQGTQWYVSTRWERLCDYMLIIFFICSGPSLAPCPSSAPCW